MTSLSIGIGIVTRNRKDALAKVIQRIRDTTVLPFELIVGTDRCDDGTHEYLRQVGVPYVIPPEPGAPANRNAVLHALRRYDVIFEFEDDFAPKRVGWMERHIHALMKSPVRCLVCLGEGHGPLLDTVDYPGGRIDVWQSLTSQMTAMTRQVIEEVGYYSTAFGSRYGYEDGEWGTRVVNAGLTRQWASLPDTGEWFEYLDVPSSDGKSVETRLEEAGQNERVWAQLREDGLIYRPYPFDES